MDFQITEFITLMFNWSCVVCTFSLSVHSWMALGMSLAVFSFVMEQTSFNFTVSCTTRNTERTNSTSQLETHWTSINTEIIKCFSIDVKRGAIALCPTKWESYVNSPAFPSGRCCYRNRSSSRRGRGDPAGECLSAGHRSSLSWDKKFGEYTLG